MMRIQLAVQCRCDPRGQVVKVKAKVRTKAKAKMSAMIAKLLSVTLLANAASKADF